MNLGPPKGAPKYLFAYNYICKKVYKFIPSFRASDVAHVGELASPGASKTSPFLTYPGAPGSYSQKTKEVYLFA